jgi:hypothetical protein
MSYRRVFLCRQNAQPLLSKTLSLRAALSITASSIV